MSSHSSRVKSWLSVLCRGLNGDPPKLRYPCPDPGTYTRGLIWKSAFVDTIKSRILRYLPGLEQALNPVERPYEREKETDTQAGALWGQRQMVQPPAKGPLKPPGAGRSRKDPPPPCPGPPRGAQPHPHLDLRLLAPELGERESLPVYTRQFTIICFGSPRTLRRKDVCVLVSLPLSRGPGN